MAEVNREEMSYQRKKKDQFVMPSYVAKPRPRPRREPFFLNVNNLSKRSCLRN